MATTNLISLLLLGTVIAMEPDWSICSYFCVSARTGHASVISALPALDKFQPHSALAVHMVISPHPLSKWSSANVSR